ncbi:MAG: hypothetical protein NTV88_05215, partial [Candidatus Micrarchaeota archaeon]|nr:hypothetical protein [Candidatus Micrarchaeota archaeon]
MGQNRIFPLFIFCLLALSQGAFAAGPAVGCTLSFDAAHTPLPGQPEDPLAVPDSASMIASCTDINSNQVICPAFDWTQTATGASITSSDHTPPSMNPSVTLSVPLGVAPEILKKVSATDSTQPLLTCYKNFNIGFAPSGPTCQLTPVRTYLDVSADPKNKLLGTTLYQIGSTYDKTPVKKGLIFQITMVSGQAASICYSTTNDVTGEASFTYDPQAQGCTNYRYIFCPQKMATDPGAGGIAARTQCLGDTGIDPNLPVSVCYGGTAIPNNYPAYLPAQNEFYFCNVVPNAPNMAALCWPLLLIFGLLTGASFAAGRNPFQAFDFSAPRMSRGRQYSMRNQQMSFDAMSGYYAADKASNNKLSETLSKKVVNPAMNTVGKGIKGAVKGVGSVFKTEAGKKLDKKEADLKKKQQEEINKNMPKAMPGDNKNIDLNKKKSSFDLVETTPDGRKVASNAGNSVMMAYNWAAGKELKNKTTKFMVNGKEITVKGQLTPKQVLQIQELSEKGRGKIIKEQFSGENLKDRLLKGGLGGLLSLAAMGGLNWLPGMRSAFMTTGWGAKMLAGTFYVVNTDRLPWGLNLLAPSIDAVKTDALKQWLEWTSKVTPDDRLENGYLSKDKTGVLFTTIKDGKEIYVYYDVKSNTTREATDADKKNFDLSTPPQYLQIGVNDGRVNIIQLSSSDYYSRMGDQGKQNEYVAKMIEYQLENSWTKGNLTLYKEKSNEVTQLLIYSRAQQDASEFYLQSKGDPKDGDAMKLLQLKVDVSRAAYETTATSTNSVQNGLWVEKYYDKAEDMTKLQLNKKLTETEKTVGTYKTLLEDTTEKIQKKNQEIEQKKVNGIDVTKDLNELKDLVGKQYELQKTYDERKVELNIYKEVQYGGMSTPDRETMKTTAKDDLKKTNDIIEKIYAGTATDDEKKQYSDLNEKKTQLERIVEDYERIDFKRDYENLSGKEQGKALKTEEKLQTKYTLEMNRIDSDIAKLDEKVNSNTATEDDKAQLTNLKASRETTFANLNSTNLKVSTYSAVNEGFDRNDELLLKYTQQVTDVRISRSISSTYSELTNIVGSFNVTPKEQVELTAYAQTKIQTGNERDLSTLENNIKYINNITGTL